MATNQPSSGPDRDAPSSDQAQWLTDSRTKIEQNRPLAPAQRVEQFREIVKGRTLSDLEELAKLIVAAPFSLSQIEERELAVRVRELLSPKELKEKLAKLKKISASRRIEAMAVSILDDESLKKVEKILNAIKEKK